MSAGERLFKCLSCDKEFTVAGDKAAEKCPFCRSRFLVLLEGDPLPKQGGCAPSG